MSQHKHYTAFGTLKSIDFCKMKMTKKIILLGLAANGITAAMIDIPENAFPTSSSSMHLDTIPLDEEKRHKSSTCTPFIKRI